MIGKWRRTWQMWCCAALIGFSGSAQAAFHAWQITEVYSNASGTVQYITLTALGPGQQFLMSPFGQHDFTSSQGGTTHTLTFPNNLPGDTAGKKMLIGTAGFAALGIVAPDFVVPNGFLFTTNGSLTYAQFYDFFSYASLPADGVSALNISLNGIPASRVVTIAVNSPTNFAGNTGSIAPPAATSPDAPVIGTATAGIGQVSVAFAAPGNDGGASITSFSAFCGTQNSSGPGSPIVVTGLAAGVPVVCTVSATNRVGTSPQSNSSNQVTPLGVPGAPGIGTVSAGDAQVVVNFTTPGNNGGSALTGYTATCGTQSASAGSSPITVPNLVNGVAVTCRVVANNAQGSSVPSAVSNSVTPSTVPGAPLIVNGIAGDGAAFIGFAPPADSGGAVITGYTATCNPGAFTGSGAASPITVGGLANTFLHTCSVIARNANGPGGASATVDVTPLSNPPLTPLAVQSRKTHVGVGSFDVPITPGVVPGGPVNVEPRFIGDGHTLVFLFNAPVTSYATLTATPPGMASALPAGNEMRVTLTGVPDNQRVTVALTDVNGAGVNIEATIGFLVGDVTNSRSVNARDIGAVKAHAGQPVDQTNFRFDLNASGTIGTADISAVKSRSGLVLP